MTDKYVFIDRDGVINKDPGGRTEYGYVVKWEDFIFLPGVIEAFKKLHEAGFRNVIISNQQSVGKGYFSKEDLNEIDLKMRSVIEEGGGSITGSYYCIHRKEEGCDCRKPKEGLFVKAQEDLGISSMQDKFFIGDTERDMQAGKKAGLSTILVLSGKTTEEDAAGWECKPDHICKDLLEASELVINNTKK